MVRTFIDLILDDLLAQQIDITTLNYVVPSRRVGIFLQKAIAIRQEKPILSPKTQSIEDFVQEFSQLHILPDLEILPYFYKAYCESTPIDRRDSFDAFIGWAPSILKDFNEIDRYLINQSQFFDDLGNYKALDSNYHWSLDANPTTMVSQYLDFWKRLYQYYQALKEILIAEKLAYQGLAYRVACENILNSNVKGEDKSRTLFIGLNALNKAESQIIQHLLEENDALIYWDADTYFLSQSFHEAGKFMRSYKKDWSYYEKQNFTLVGNQYDQSKNFKIISATGNLGMVQAARRHIESLDQETLQNTAVILADEQLLLPFLSALPDNVESYNITMGLSLDNLPISDFFNNVFQLHRERSNQGYYYKNLTRLLDSSFSQLLAPIESSAALRAIRKENLIHIKEIDFEKNQFPFIHQLLQPLQQPQEIVDLALSILDQLKRSLKHKKNARLELEQLLGMSEVMNELADLLRDNDNIGDLRTLTHLLRQLLPLKKLDFIGEPVRGLQIMGLLETRALDYENIVMLSVNEGTLPAGKSFNSYIPHEMKRAFDLPTYTEKDSIYSYHFYRLLHRCNNATFIYNDETDTLGGGEKSRFLLQIERESPKSHNIEHINYFYKVEAIENKLIELQKEDTYFTRLQEIAIKGFSPSALTSYVRNPLDFFSNKILGIADLEDVEENIALNTMGSIIHEALDKLYQPYQKRILTLTDFQKIKGQIKTELDLAYRTCYQSQSKPIGKNKIIYEVSLHYVKKMVQSDMNLVKEGKELIIKSVEQNLSSTIEVPHIGQVKLHGKVDRVDSLDGVIRIIDYKSGSVDKANVGISKSFTELIEDYDRSKAFQVLMYAYLYLANHPQQQVEAGIISFKNFNAGFIPFSIKKGRSYVKQPINQEVLQEFIDQLTLLLQELFDPNVALLEKKV